VRKVTIDDIRLTSWWHNVVAAPKWAYKRNDRPHWFDGEWSIIPEAWVDIKAEFQRRKDAISPRNRYEKYLKGGKGFHILRGRHASPETCLVCGQLFMAWKHGYRPRLCTEKCRQARRAQWLSMHKSRTNPRPHVEHSPQPCVKCGEPFM